MAKLRLLANMNISPETVNALQEKGLDIIRVSQIFPVTSSPKVLFVLNQPSGYFLPQYRSD